VIVGRVEGAVVPPYHISVTFNVPGFTAWLDRWVGGMRYPRRVVRRAQAELDGFTRLLEAEGVRVRRPDIIKSPHPASHTVLVIARFLHRLSSRWLPGGR